MAAYFPLLFSFTHTHNNTKFHPSLACKSKRETFHQSSICENRNHTFAFAHQNFYMCNFPLARPLHRTQKKERRKKKKKV